MRKDGCAYTQRGQFTKVGACWQSFIFPQRVFWRGNGLVSRDASPLQYKFGFGELAAMEFLATETTEELKNIIKSQVGVMIIFKIIALEYL